MKDKKDIKISIKKLRKIADYYGFPILAFFMPLKDFQRIIGTRRKYIFRKVKAFNKIVKIIEEYRKAGIKMDEITDKQILKKWTDSNVYEIEELYKRIADRVGLKWIIIRRKKGNRFVRDILDNNSEQVGWSEIYYEDDNYIYLLEKLEE